MPFGVIPLLILAALATAAAPLASQSVTGGSPADIFRPAGSARLARPPVLAGPPAWAIDGDQASARAGPVPPSANYAEDRSRWRYPLVGAAIGGAVGLGVGLIGALDGAGPDAIAPPPIVFIGITTGLGLTAGGLIGGVAALFAD